GHRERDTAGRSAGEICSVRGWIYGRGYRQCSGQSTTYGPCTVDSGREGRELAMEAGLGGVALTARGNGADSTAYRLPARVATGLTKAFCQRQSCRRRSASALACSA